jgi:hypothetical protein
VEGVNVGSCIALVMLDDEFMDESPWTVELSESERLELKAWESEKVAVD